MNIPASLKKIRLENGLTMKQLTDNLDIPYRTYQSYELNTRELSLSNALKLAQFYKLSIEQLISYDK